MASRRTTLSRKHAGLGRYVSPYSRIRGEYPTVATSFQMIPARCALSAAWGTPIFNERKARRTFSRMRDRMVKFLGERADVVRGSGDEMLLRREQDRLRGTELVFADRVPCQHGSSGCYTNEKNTIYFRRSVFAHRPGEHGPVEPFRQLTHGALVHEMAHAAALSTVRVKRYLTLPPGQTEGTLVDAYHVGRRQPHGPRFAARLSQAVRAWCETEGRPVCTHYCRPRPAGR